MNRLDRGLRRAHYLIHYIVKGLERGAVRFSPARRRELDARTHARHIKGHLDHVVTNYRNASLLNRLIASIYVGDIVRDLDIAHRLVAGLDWISDGQHLERDVWSENVARTLERATT